MVSTYTSSKAHLQKPANGDLVGSWDTAVNGNSDLIDACISASASIVMSNANVSLSQAQMQNMRLVITGALAGNLSLIFLASVPGTWIIDNQTTGSYTITAITAAGGSTGVTVPQGYRSYVVSDGTNVYYSDDHYNTAIAAYVPPGAIMQFAMNSAPSGWLICDGTAYSRTTYAALYANISTVWGAGDGVTTFNVPDFRGAFLRGLDSGKGYDPARVFASYQADAYASHSHSITDPGHVHAAGNNSLNYANGVAAGATNAQGTTWNTASASTGITGTNASGGTETRPKNYAILYCIRT